MKGIKGSFNGKSDRSHYLESSLRFLAEDTREGFDSSAREDFNIIEKYADSNIGNEELSSYVDKFRERELGDSRTPKCKI